MSDIYKGIVNVPMFDESANVRDRSCIENFSASDWNVSMARTWRYMKAPSRPSQSELKIYERYFDKVGVRRGLQRPKVLILGSTTEFRKLAYNKDFAVVVVDYSREYYDEISRDLEKEIVEKEEYHNCHWCKMDQELKGSKFDIIIGDLAIGNIKPEDFDKFISNIALLLSDQGYFLGKSIYKYSSYDITRDKVLQLLKDLSDNNEITEENLYSYAMYPLSVYASEKIETDAGSVYKVNFEKIYETVGGFIKANPEITNNKFSIYTKEETQFDKKMPQLFFIYSYQYLINKIGKVNLYINDTMYSDDPYKDDFPLLIIKHKSVRQEENVLQSGGVAAFLSGLYSENPEFAEKWNNSISALYFLYNFFDIVEYSDNNSIIFNLIKKLLSNSTIKINNQLYYYLAKIPEDSMLAETKLLTDNTGISNKENLKGDLQFNYTCAIVAWILHKYSIENKLTGNLLNLVVDSLFDNKKSGLWSPQESPWLSARICISLFPIYKEWKNNKTNKDKTEKLERVIRLLAQKSNFENDYFWESETGSHFDTSALCIEALYLYSDDVNGVKATINNIINTHVKNGLIKETFIKYPIFESIIDQVCRKCKINGKVAHKKLCGRIEWYSILYNVCKDWGQKREDTELMNMSEYIAQQLKRFWWYFQGSAKDIVQATIDLEKALVPQILYCLKSTNLFD